MSAVASRSRARTRERERTLSDRFLAAAPLLSVFFWLSVVYAWEAWRHGSPWLFGDELELSQLSRAIAATGHAARRGEPHSFDSLYTYFIAPAWLIENVHHAYATVKYLDVVTMTATIFPAYGLARFVVSRNAAIVVGAAAGLIPALVYTSLVVEEPLAYPYSTLCLFLIVGALLRRTRWWIGGAVAASILAPAVRGELKVIPLAFLLAALFLYWRGARMERWRLRWSVRDWLGAVVLAVGALVTLSAFLGHHWYEWLIATGFYKHRMWTLGLRAGGALTIGLGVLPVVGGLASLWRAPGERFAPEVRVFRSVLLASLIGFCLYTAVKASYVSTTFGTYTVERNLIYLSPLLLLGTALCFERRRVNPVALAGGALVALYLILTTPYEMQFQFYSDAPGLAILEQANRVLGLTPGAAKVGLLALLAVSVALLVLPRLLPRAAVAGALAAALLVGTWTLTGQLAAASASNSYSKTFLSNIHGSPTWLDERTGGAPTLYLGQQMQDQNSEWLLEFWNRSIRQVWSLDGTAQGPGPTLTPDIRGTDGVLKPDPGYRYVVAETGIEPVGKPVAAHLHSAGGRLQDWTLYRVTHPLALRGAVTGLYADAWSGSDSAYTRYSTQGGRTGAIAVRLSRLGWGGVDVPGRVKITIGTLGVGPDHQPTTRRITKTLFSTIHSRGLETFVLKAPGPRFRVEVHIAPTFVPQKLSPQTSSDARNLGAVITYRFRKPGDAGR